MSDVVQRNSALHRKLAGIHQVNVEGGFEGQSVPAVRGGMTVLPPEPTPLPPVTPEEQAQREALYAQEHGRVAATRGMESDVPATWEEENNERLPAVPVVRRAPPTDDEGRELAMDFDQQPEDPEPATRRPVRQRRTRQPGETHIMPTTPAPVQLGGGAPTGFESIDLVNAVVVADNGQTYPFHEGNLKMLNKFAFDVAAQAMQQQFAGLAQSLGINPPQEETPKEEEPNDGNTEVPDVSSTEDGDELREDVDESDDGEGDSPEAVQPVQKPNPRRKGRKA